jgi:hypothetical protein
MRWTHHCSACGGAQVALDAGKACGACGMGPATKVDCGEAGHDEGRCGNAACLPTEPWSWSAQDEADFAAMTERRTAARNRQSVVAFVQVLRKLADDLESGKQPSCEFNVEYLRRSASSEPYARRYSVLVEEPRRRDAAVVTC